MQECVSMCERVCVCVRVSAQLKARYSLAIAHMCDGSRHNRTIFFSFINKLRSER